MLGKAVLVAALLAPAIAMGAGAGAVAAAGKGFKAGKYYNPTATIATLSRTELKHATKVENIDGMLALLSVERRGNLDETFKLQAWERYNAIPDGDLLLLPGASR